MTQLDQTSTVPSSVSKKKKAKFFFEHGKDALELARSVAHMQEQKALRKTEKHHQPQVGKPRTERKKGDRANKKGKQLEEAKAMIARRQAEAKRQKAKSRNESNSRLQQRNDARIIAPEESTSTAPRKRVSFA